MKKKVLSVLLVAAMAMSMLTGCGSSNNAGTAATGEAQNSAAASTTTEQASTATDAGTTAGSDTLIALITMDSLDQHWVTLNEGAQKAAAELGVTVQFMAPNTKDDAQQIECVNNAVSAGAQAIIVAANGPDAISSALREASDAGVKLIYVDSPANVSAEATFSTDNNAAGKTAGEEMKKALADAGVTSGSIGIINVNAATDSCVMREEGFRSAFEGTDFELLETQYGEGDAAKSQSIAENYITQGVVGIFGCNEGSTTGAGNAIKASGKDNVIGVGFDKSDAILGLIDDGYLLCTMAQNPDVMGYEGVKAAVKAGADIIISGAGLPTELPELVKGSLTKIAPIVSTDKSAKVILKYWDRKYKRTADLVVIEGPQAGGHLGFHKDELEKYTEESYSEEIKKIIATVESYAEKYQTEVPVIVAGGICDKEDVQKVAALGVDGVQVATRFITTEECDADIRYKEAHLNARKEDIAIVKSPVGMPGRAIMNKFMKRVMSGEQISHSPCHGCLVKCSPKEIPYCITDGLINAVKGNVDDGLLFCGAKAWKADRLETVQEVISELF